MVASLELGPVLPGHPQLLLKPEDAARVLGIGRTKLYMLIGEGRIGSVRIGGSRRVPVEALEEFIRGLRLPDALPVASKPSSGPRPGQDMLIRRSPKGTLAQGVQSRLPWGAEEPSASRLAKTESGKL